jgi:hypothetical protein
MNNGACTALLRWAGWKSVVAGCFPRNPERLKKDRGPWPEADRSRFRDDCGGGGGNAGEIET